MAERRRWSRGERILARNLYLKLPFGKLHSGTPEIIHLANLIHRTPGSVAMRLNNFAAVDPFHQQRGIGGLPGGQKRVAPIWNEFVHNKEELLFEGERILAARENIPLEEKFSAALQEVQSLKGEDKLQHVKTRVNQDVFCQMVLTNDAGKCALSGIDIPDLLVASHILSWAKNEQARLNPENGICLSALYGKAYDKGYIGITEKLDVVVSPVLKKKGGEPYYPQWFAFLQGAKITRPQKWRPGKAFLQYHMAVVFKQ